MSIHDTHPDIIKRLKRAEGHLRSVVAMLEAGRPCVEIAQQLHAVERAIANAKQVFVHDHIDHCLDHAIGSGELDPADAIRELKTITQYL